MMSSFMANDPAPKTWAARRSSSMLWNHGRGRRTRDAGALYSEIVGLYYESIGNSPARRLWLCSVISFFTPGLTGPLVVLQVLLSPRTPVADITALLF